MKIEEIQDRRLRELVVEFCQRIKARYPEAAFRLYRWNGDPKSIYIDAYTFEEENGFLVLDPVAERAMEVLVEEDYDIHVIPLPLSSLTDPTAAWRQPNCEVGAEIGG